MGAILPKPVMTKLHERAGGAHFRVGSSCVNGHRDNMEDAHSVVIKDGFGFFGIFDGHVNARCSAYLEKEFTETMSQVTAPLSDERVKEIALEIDKKFLLSEQEGGSTGTWVLAYVEGAVVHLQVGNVGDSRVLVGRAGQCFPLTNDHKPNLDAERRRIVECGGRVENNRVDGSLAISRAFGDRDYKRFGDDQLLQKVIALADVSHMDVDLNSGDFCVLGCDGVFEGQFSNQEVVAFVAEELKRTTDLADIAGRVCEEAVARGSKDNISCMVVMFGSGDELVRLGAHEVVPGPFGAPNHGGFRRAYEFMALKGGMATVGECLEKRYSYLKGLTTRSPDEEAELRGFKGGPPATAADRVAWFDEFFAGLAEAGAGGGAKGGVSADHMMRMQMLQEQIGVPLPMILELMAMGRGMGPAGAQGGDK